PRRCRDVDEHTAALDPYRKRGDTVLFETGFTEAGATMEFPAVPRTDDIVLIEAAIAQRPARMIAHIRHCAPCSIAERQRNIDIVDLVPAQRLLRELLCGTEIDPVVLPCHVILRVATCCGRVPAFCRDFSGSVVGQPEFDRYRPVARAHAAAAHGGAVPRVEDRRRGPGWRLRNPNGAAVRCECRALAPSSPWETVGARRRR